MSQTADTLQGLRNVLRVSGCKYCGSARIIRYGYSKGGRRVRCLECGHTFIWANSLPFMRFSTDVVASAIELCGNGHTLNAVRVSLYSQYGVTPSVSSIFRWKNRF